MPPQVCPNKESVSYRKKNVLVPEPEHANNPNTASSSFRAEHEQREEEGQVLLSSSILLEKQAALLWQLYVGRANVRASISDGLDSHIFF